MKKRNKCENRALLRARLWLLITLLLFLQGPPLLHGQSAEDRTPKFNPQQLSFTTHSQFPDAEAIVLSDVGTFTTVDGGNKWLGRTHRKIRIQILAETEIDRGDVELYYYHEDGEENIVQVKGRTYNLVGGRMETNVLKKKEIFREKLDDEYSKVTFSLPNVRVGSIIEYEYARVEQNLFTLTPWYFQTDIPTLLSDYKVFLPPNYDYTYVVLGSNTENFQALENNNWKVGNIPGIKEEPYASSLINYRTQIRLQMRGYHRGGSYKRVLDDWPSFTQKLLTNHSLGERINQKVKVDPLFWLKLSALSDEKEKMISIYNHVKDKMKWDGEHQYLCFRRTDKAYEEGKGTSAEINMILIHLLKEAGLRVDPLLISTRDRLKPIKDYPLVTAFNQILAHVVIEGETYILDATDPLRPYNLLAFEDLHHMGWLLNKENPKWVKIPTKYPALQSVSVVGSFEEEGFTAGFNGFNKGYYALDVRKELLTKGEDKFAQGLSASMVENEEGEIFTVDNPASLDEAVSWKYQVKENEYVRTSGDMIYIDPMFGFNIEENPFQAKERFYPVDFGHTFQENYSFTMIIPDGYEVESLPESQRFKLPENVASFEYVVGEEDGKIQMRSSISIRETLFIPKGYFYLRELFDKMIAKQAEQWVLKKKS
ncbi:MAG: DUF3857 domain-containing protein [Bacteroidota bacterium]